MVKRGRESDSDGTTTRTAEYNTVFVDTNLDTHLAMRVSNVDTVSDFKRKIKFEHMQCFPKTGEILIHSLKVERRANFYHLPDIMLVWSAFQGVETNWFLSADVHHVNSSSLDLGASELTKMDVRSVDDNNLRVLSTDINMMQKCLPMPWQDDAELIHESKAEKSLGKTDEFQSNCYSEENFMTTESPAKKKRKISFQDGSTLFHASGDYTSRPEIGKHNTRSKEVENIIPKNIMASKVENGPGQDVPIKNSGGVSIRVPDSSGAKTGDVTPKRNKRKRRKAAKKIQAMMTVMEQTAAKDDIIKPLTETHAAKKEDENDMSLNHDHEIIMPSDNKASDRVDPDLVPKRASSGSHFCDVNASVEPEISSGNKKKRRKKNRNKGNNSADTNTEKLDMEKTDNGGSGSHLVCPQTDHALEETHNEENIVYPKEKDVHMPLLDTSTQDVSEKVKTADRNEADVLILTQSEQALDDVVTGDKKIDGNNQISAGNCLAQPPAVEKDNAIVEFNKVENDIKNPEAENDIKNNEVENDIKNPKVKNDSNNPEVGNDSKNNDVNDINNQESKNEKSEKKRKKRKLKGSDVQENLAVHVASLQVPSNKSQENLEEMHVTPVISDDRARSSKNEALGINSKEYFLTGPSEDKVENDIKNSKVENDIKNPEVENDIKNNGVDNDIKNLESKDGKSEKKRKKRKLKGSDVQENLAVHVASLQVPSNKSQENLEEMHVTPVISDDQARSSENEALGINFKEYFLTGSSKDKADPGNRKAIMSNEETKASEKVNDNGLPLIGVPTESQDSFKPSINKGSKKKTRAKKDTSRGLGESAESSALDEVVPDSSKRSSKASENGDKDSVPREICETILQKPEEICVAPSSLKEKPSLDKSSSGKSETFPDKRENKSSQPVLSVTKKMVMRTPKVKNLLTKPGSIFQVNSGESSGDENGTMHFNGRLGSPSDSSSVSGDSVGKSDLSQDSTRNGSSDTKGRSTGGKSISKLDLSASKDMTLDMILRSSKRFKKAKLQASQNEAEDIEFVPDSQPT